MSTRINISSNLDGLIETARNQVDANRRAKEEADALARVEKEARRRREEYRLNQMLTATSRRDVLFYGPKVGASRRGDRVDFLFEWTRERSVTDSTVWSWGFIDPSSGQLDYWQSLLSQFHPYLPPFFLSLPQNSPVLYFWEHVDNKTISLTRSSAATPEFATIFSQRKAELSSMASGPLKTLRELEVQYIEDMVRLLNNEEDISTVSQYSLSGEINGRDYTTEMGPVFTSTKKRHSSGYPSQDEWLNLPYRQRGINTIIFADLESDQVSVRRNTSIERTFGFAPFDHPWIRPKAPWIPGPNQEGSAIQGLYTYTESRSIPFLSMYVTATRPGYIGVEAISPDNGTNQDDLAYGYAVREVKTGVNFFVVIPVPSFSRDRYSKRDVVINYQITRTPEEALSFPEVRKSDLFRTDPDNLNVAKLRKPVTS